MTYKTSTLKILSRIYVANYIINFYKGHKKHVFFAISTKSSLLYFSIFSMSIIFIYSDRSQEAQVEKWRSESEKVSSCCACDKKQVSTLGSRAHSPWGPLGNDIDSTSDLTHPDGLI